MIFKVGIKSKTIHQSLILWSFHNVGATVEVIQHQMRWEMIMNG